MSITGKSAAEMMAGISVKPTAAELRESQEREIKAEIALLDGLANWLKHMQSVNASLAHIPEMAAHIENLKRWEMAVRDLTEDSK